MFMRAYQNGWGPNVPTDRDADGLRDVLTLMGGRYWFVFNWGKNAVDQRWWTVQYYLTAGGTPHATQVFY